MEHEQFTIEIEGEEASDLYPDLLGLEVELDACLAGMLRLRLATRRWSDGLWAHVDDERLRVWKKVKIQAGFESGTEDLITGYVTHVKPLFEPDPALCTLEVWAMDESVLMDREEKLRDWPNKKDSDVAREIFEPYGFDVKGVVDTQVVHDEEVSTVIQRETDMQFLKRLALRNGFECYVDNGKACFRPPQVDAPPQPVLAVHFGDQTNVERFQLEVNALAPSQVAMSQVDPASKQVLVAAAEKSLLPALGEIGADALPAAGIAPGRVHVAKSSTTGPLEMATLCQGLFHRAEWFVTAEGEIASSRYGHVLRPRLPVTIKGVSETHSGVYLVCHVTHSFHPGGYNQRFKARRNALLPSGKEEFST